MQQIEFPHNSDDSINQVIFGLLDKYTYSRRKYFKRIKKTEFLKHYDPKQNKINKKFQNFYNKVEYEKLNFNLNFDRLFEPGKTDRFENDSDIKRNSSYKTS